MKLENSFEVPAPPERAWALLMDVPRVIPCMPGAELTETVDDGTWKARMNVKLGPIALTFQTDVQREASDVEARRAVLSAKARETRGRGAGQATIESTLTPTDGGTRVDIVTDLTLTGAVAQQGRGMVQMVSTQLVDSFAKCLAEQLEDKPPPAEEIAAAAPAAGGNPAASSAPTSQAEPLKALPLMAKAIRAEAAPRARRLAQTIKAEAGPRARQVQAKLVPLARRGYTKVSEAARRLADRGKGGTP
jgi:uncharacterized protein